MRAPVCRRCRGQPPALARQQHGNLGARAIGRPGGNVGRTGIDRRQALAQHGLDSVFPARFDVDALPQGFLRRRPCRCSHSPIFEPLCIPLLQLLGAVLRASDSFFACSAVARPAGFRAAAIPAQAAAADKP